MSIAHPGIIRVSLTVRFPMYCKLVNWTLRERDKSQVLRKVNDEFKAFNFIHTAIYLDY